MAGLVIGPKERADLLRLRAKALDEQVDINAPFNLLKMAGLTIDIPIGYAVTYSIDKGNAFGLSRHMSMTTAMPGKVPSPEAVWMIAEVLGFRLSLAACRSWPEQLPDGRVAINIAQPVGDVIDEAPPPPGKLN